MAAVVRPRGKLPARVYWFRRAVVLGVMVGLVAVVVRLVPGGGSEAPTAVVVENPDPSAAPTAVTSPRPAKRTPATKKPTPTKIPLAVPDGPCSAEEITVTPTIDSAAAGGPVRLALELTSSRPACTFAVSARTLVAKVTSGSDRIWSTQDCAAAVPEQVVVVRSEVPAKVTVTWSGRRSDSRCSARTTYALPGYYHVLAAVLGAKPSDKQFRLTLPPRPVVTETVQPEPVKKTTKKKRG